MVNTDHLDALRLRLSHERGYLAAAKTDNERNLRNVWIDGIEALVADAAAAEPSRMVHEGGEYYAERVIRRAIAQGSLKLAGDFA